MDHAQMQKGQEWLKKLMDLMQVDAQVAIAKVEQEPDNTICTWLTIGGTELTHDQIEAIIGKGGKTIDAIQYLANAILHIGKETQQSSYFMIDINGYRQQRLQELTALAEKVAAEVRTTATAVEIPSLSSVERRQIHSLLSQATDLQTESKGQEPERRLVVRPR